MILFNNFVSPADSSKILYLTKNTLRGGPKIRLTTGYFTF